MCVPVLAELARESLVSSLAALLRWCVSYRIRVCLLLCWSAPSPTLSPTDPVPRPGLH